MDPNFQPRNAYRPDVTGPNPNLNRPGSQNYGPQPAQQPMQQPVQEPARQFEPRRPTMPRLDNSAEPSTININGISADSNIDNIKPMPKSRGFGAFKGIASILELVGGALLLAFAINTFVFQSYQVFGMSMSPTLHQDDRLIISKMGKSWSNLFKNDFVPERGKVIVFESPKNDNLQLVKRVVGLPGEKVTVKDGIITVYNEQNPNGFNPDELIDVDFTDEPTGNIEVQVPAGHIFVAGDNRTPGGSLDSRNDLGTVPIELVVGTLKARIFPLSQADFY